MLSILASTAHVPTYSCKDNCCAFPHDPPVSQVVYLKGTGGAEIHIKDDLDPFNTTANEALDFDLTFRDRPETGTFTVRIGCGSGCLPEEIGDAPVYDVTGFKPAVIEPFTQTVYRSGTEGEFGSPSRVFNTSALAASACPANAEGVRHFVITLEDHGNSSVSPIVWGAVVGCEGARGCEQFTPRELIEFPIYIWRNHSSHWTGLPWWLALLNFLFASIAVVGVRELLRTCFATWCWVGRATGRCCDCWTRFCGRVCCCVSTHGWTVRKAVGRSVFYMRVRGRSEAQAASKADGRSYAVFVAHGQSYAEAATRGLVREREALYGLAVLGWTWAMVDMTMHYFIALTADDLSDDPDDLAFANVAFWVGVIAWGNLLPLSITLLCWWGTRFGPDRCVAYAWWTRPDIWAPVEILTGVSWFFNFGAGYYVGPSATVLAGLVRLGEIRNMREPFWMQLRNSFVRMFDGESNQKTNPFKRAKVGDLKAEAAGRMPDYQYHAEAEGHTPLPALNIKCSSTRL